MSKVGFPPIIGCDPKVLILGSMPSEASLSQNQYYAHPQNAFWYIMGRLFSFNAKATYAERKALLIKNRVALWDVLQECERDGSLDSSIIGSSIKTNNFLHLLASHPTIQLIVFNGATAEKVFKKRVFPNLKTQLEQIQIIRLPSTSPAMAALTREQKMEKWSEIVKVIA
ncbi:DNA-deoxyinosine glycosylase [Pseudomonadota bacterium]